MKLWELHAANLDGAIRTTPDGEADVAGLVLSEKAYLLVVRDLRPAELVALVRRDGPQKAAEALVARFARPSQPPAGGGRGLVLARSRIGDPGIARDDELAEGGLMGRRL